MKKRCCSSANRQQETEVKRNAFLTNVYRTKEKTDWLNGWINANYCAKFYLPICWYICYFVATSYSLLKSDVCSQLIDWNENQVETNWKWKQFRLRYTGLNVRYTFLIYDSAVFGLADNCNSQNKKNDKYEKIMVSNEIGKSAQFPRSDEWWLDTHLLNTHFCEQITLPFNDSHFNDLNLIIIIVAIKMKCSIRMKQFSL